MNSEKRETLIRGFARIQEYALERERIIRETFKSVSECSNDDLAYRDFYTESSLLPQELYKIEILYNLGRAFHQVGLRIRNDM